MIPGKTIKRLQDNYFPVGITLLLLISSIILPFLVFITLMNLQGNFKHFQVKGYSFPLSY